MVRMQADGSLPPQQRRNYRHAGEALARIVRSEGVGSLWRGVSSTVSRAVIVTSAQMSFYDKAKDLLVAGAFGVQGLGFRAPRRASACASARPRRALRSAPLRRDKICDKIC